MRSVIRFDAGSAIGLGHATRALALASELERLTGSKPVVVARPDPLLADLLGRAGLERIAPAAPGYALPDVLAAAGADGVVVSDTYELDEAALDGIAAAGLAHLVVDDFGLLERWPCQVIVNPNTGSESLRYPGAGEVLRGPRYALLRPEVLEAAAVPGPRDGVIVCLGGGTWPEEAGALLESLAALAATTQVRVTTDRHVPRPLVAVPPGSLSTELASSAVGVLSGGVVKYEAAHCGLPAVLVAVVEHQEPIAEAFSRRGAASYAGRLGEIGPDAVVAEVRRLLEDDPARAAMATAGRLLVDGLGARRAVERLLAAVS